MSPAAPRSWALAGFIASITTIAVAYGSAFLPGGTPAWGPWFLAFGTAGSMASVMVLGVATPGRRLGMLGWVFGATFLVVAGGFGLALSMPAETVDTTLWLGLPRRAAVLIYGIGLLPVVFLPVSYAVTFDRIVLSEHDMARLHAGLAELRAADAARTGALPPADPRDVAVGA